jgi:hypothetical protein
VPGWAQALGLGPQLSFVNADTLSSTPASSSLGGILRFKASARLTTEFSLDYHATTDGSVRTRDMPFQASLLIYPLRTRLAPYLVAGYGIYTEATDTLNLSGQPTNTVVTRRTGWHAGVGGDLHLGRHATIYLDYRYRFVQFGTPPAASEPIDLPIPGLSGKLSHQGSMWTSGMAFFF